MKTSSWKGFFGLLLTLLCTPHVASSAGVVTNCDETSLRTALAGGGTVTFACDGTITLTNQLEITNDTVLDASGRSVILSGNSTTRIFAVSAGVSLTLSNLTVANGRNTGTNGNPGYAGGPARGGAVFVNGTLNAIDCRFWTNSTVGGDGGVYLSIPGQIAASGDGGSAQGGAILVEGGALNATNSEFAGNCASGGAGGNATSPYHATGIGGHAFGGAIYLTNGTVSLAGCKFLRNETRGGLAGYDDFNTTRSGDASGGAMCGAGGDVVITGCRFESNGGMCLQLMAHLSSGLGGIVRGGAIYNDTGGAFVLTATEFVGNTAVGGDSPRVGSPGPGQGGAIYNRGQMQLVSTIIDHNEAIGGKYGTVGANGEGGGVFNLGQLRIMQTVLDANQAKGGSGNHGGIGTTLDGVGRGGAIFNTNQLAISDSTFSSNSAIGGPGWHYNANGAYPGSAAFGGAIYSAGTCTLTNNTLAANAANGAPVILATAPPISILGGDGFGGGVYNTNGAVISINNTFVGNAGRGGVGFPDGIGYGGGVASTNGGVSLINTLIAGSLSGSNGFGLLTDGGHNLSSDGSCNFTNVGSLNNTDPKLGPLGDYGGPTPTIPLLTGSPAIDGGEDLTAPPTDQRGRARPYGAMSDIGAFESSSPYVISGRLFGFNLSGEVEVSTSTTNVMTTNHAYCLSGLPPAAYTVTPVDANYLFMPNNRLVTVGPDQVNVNFKAYRWNALSFESLSNGVLHLVYASTNGQNRVLASTNLINWIVVATNTIGPSNLFDISDPDITSHTLRFYHVVSP